MTQIPLSVRFLREHPLATLPTRGSEQAAGWDVYASSATQIQPGQSALINTGWKIAVPDGYEAQVRPRSGLAFKKQITVLNSPGTIDADYRGALGVLLFNTGSRPFKVSVGMRVAQLVIQPVLTNVQMMEVVEFDETLRGEGGFGSTGQ